MSLQWMADESLQLVQTQKKPTTKLMSRLRSTRIVKETTFRAKRKEMEGKGWMDAKWNPTEK